VDSPSNLWRGWFYSLRSKAGTGDDAFTLRRFGSGLDDIARQYYTTRISFRKSLTG
jgi:hypothetical protein